MEIVHLLTPNGPRWAFDGSLLPESFSLGDLLSRRAAEHEPYLHSAVTASPAEGSPIAPIDPHQEVWASGVTYLRSRVAREVESTSGDIYQRVYIASRPELFYKAAGWRVVGPGESIRVRKDSRWNVPEPELTLVINRWGEICGYTAGNDVSSRDIEGDNPLYLPQAKVYTGSCALGPAIHLIDSVDELANCEIRLEIQRAGSLVYEGDTTTRQMKRSLPELVEYLVRELDFPQGVFLMTGTGIVPPDTYSLQAGDNVRIIVGALTLENRTE